MFQKEKPSVSVRFSIKIPKMLYIYKCGCWQIQSDLRNFRDLKTAYVRKSLQIDQTLAETFGLEIDLLVNVLILFNRKYSYGVSFLYNVVTFWHENLFHNTGIFMGIYRWPVDSPTKGQ